MTGFSEEILRDPTPTRGLRTTINLGNIVRAQRNADAGAFGGVSVELARELARGLGAEAELFPFDSAGRPLPP